MLELDLHSHSSVSDGTCSPEILVARANANGVKVLALTDHDEVSGIAPARVVAEEHGIKLISGVEISVTWAGRTIHIVGLNVNENDQKLINNLEQNRSGRLERAEKIANEFKRIGIPDAMEGAMKFVTNPELISRKHFARFLVDKGVCANTAEAFSRYLKDGRPCYIRHDWATLSNAMQWIHESGGIAVVAHPGRYRVTETTLGAFFDEFKQLGGAGIEVVTGSHSVDQYQQYAKVANYYGFLASAGSDFHSPKDSPIDVGALPELPANVKPIWHDWF